MKISVVTITIDSDEVLERTLASVSCQRWHDIEHIVVDGREGSRPGEFLARYPDVKFVSRRRAGVYDALNYGFRQCTGDVLGLLHGGDVFAGPDILSKVGETFARYPSTSFMYGDVTIGASRAGTRARLYSGESCSPDSLAYGIVPPHPSLYMTMATWQAMGPYPTDLVIAGDFEMWVRLFTRPSLKSVYLPTTMVEMQAGGLSSKPINRYYVNQVEKLKVLRRYDIHSNPLLLGAKAIEIMKRRLARVRPIWNRSLRQRKD